MTEEKDKTQNIPNNIPASEGDRTSKKDAEKKPLSQEEAKEGSDLETGPQKRNGLRTFLKVCCWVLGIIIVLLAGAWIFVLCYFTPERLSEIASREASKYLNADVRIYVKDYKIFSTYPELYVTLDSIRVVSRSLDNLPAKQASTLPDDARQLLSTEEIHAGLDIKKLMKGDIILSEVSISKPRANIVIVNDSVNNFNIFPEIPENEKMPEFSFGTIHITGPVESRFRDISKGIELRADLDRLHLSEENDGFYNIDLGVALSAYLTGLQIEIPIKTKISGELEINPESLEARSNQLNLNINDLEVDLAFDIIHKNEQFIANRLDLGLNVPDLLSLLDYLPDSLLFSLPSQIKKLAGVIPLYVRLGLKSPYVIPTSWPKEFNMDIIPSFSFDINTSKPTNLSYNYAPGKLIKVEDLVFDLNLFMDPRRPEDSYFKIPRLSLFSEGIELHAEAEVFDPLGQTPSIEGNVLMTTTLPGALAPIFKEEGLNVNGKLDLAAEFAFSIEDLEKKILDNVNLSGTVSMPDLKLAMNKGNTDLELKNFDLKFKGSSPKVEFSSTPKLDVDLDLSMASVTVKEKGMNAGLSGVRFSVDLTNQNISSQETAKADVSVDIGKILYSAGATSFRLFDLNSDIKASLLSNPTQFFSNLNTGFANENERILAQKVNHTPLYLVPETPGTLTALMSMAKTDVSLKGGSGIFITPEYLAPITISEFNITTDLDNILIKNLSAGVEDSKMNVSGNISGLGNFLCSGSPSMLTGNLDVSFNNVNIDRLAGAYYAGIEKQTGKPYNFTLPPQGPFTAADSLCILIPRNIEGKINISSPKAQYLGYSFSPLSTEIRLDGGVASLENLTIGTPYATLSLDWTYSTSSLDNIFMGFRADIHDFEFSKFYSTFPFLVAPAPEITNLTGQLSADFRGHFNMYPSMFLEPQSMEAKFTIHGDDMIFKRTGKIEKITHLMRIKGNEPIPIKDMTINGSFHDNLLIIDPFHVSFDDYQIGIAGVNNLNGEMYYHVALEKSPFHLPFAVNLVGKFSDPEIRLGGVSIKDGREREIASDLREDLNINIMSSLRRGWLMFMGEAGKYFLKREDYAN